MAGGPVAASGQRRLFERRTWLEETITTEWLSNYLPPLQAKARDGDKKTPLHYALEVFHHDWSAFEERQRAGGGATVHEILTHFAVAGGGLQLSEARESPKLAPGSPGGNVFSSIRASIAATAQLTAQPLRAKDGERLLLQAAAERMVNGKGKETSSALMLDRLVSCSTLAFQGYRLDGPTLMLLRGIISRLVATERPPHTCDAIVGAGVPVMQVVNDVYLPALEGAGKPLDLATLQHFVAEHGMQLKRSHTDDDDGLSALVAWVWERRGPGEPETSARNAVDAGVSFLHYGMAHHAVGALEGRGHEDSKNIVALMIRGTLDLTESIIGVSLLDRVVSTPALHGSIVALLASQQPWEPLKPGSTPALEIIPLIIQQMTMDNEMTMAETIVAIEEAASLGADPNGALGGNAEATPMRMAVRHGHLSIVPTLLRSGALEEDVRVLALGALGSDTHVGWTSVCMKIILNEGGCGVPSRALYDLVERTDVSSWQHAESHGAAAFKKEATQAIRLGADPNCAVEVKQGDGIRRVTAMTEAISRAETGGSGHIGMVISLAEAGAALSAEGVALLLRTNPNVIVRWLRSPAALPADVVSRTLIDAVERGAGGARIALSDPAALIALCHGQPSLVPILVEQYAAHLDITLKAARIGRRMIDPSLVNGGSIFALGGQSLHYCPANRGDEMAGPYFLLLLHPVMGIPASHVTKPPTVDELVTMYNEDIRPSIVIALDAMDHLLHSAEDPTTMLTAVNNAAVDVRRVLELTREAHAQAAKEIVVKIYDPPGTRLNLTERFFPNKERQVALQHHYDFMRGRYAGVFSGVDTFPASLGEIGETVD